jgi:hypothetical protein
MTVYLPLHVHRNNVDQTGLVPEEVNRIYFTHRQTETPNTYSDDFSAAFSDWESNNTFVARPGDDGQADAGWYFIYLQIAAESSRGELPRAILSAGGGTTHQTLASLDSDNGYPGTSTQINGSYRHGTWCTPLTIDSGLARSSVSGLFYLSNSNTVSPFVYLPKGVTVLSGKQYDTFFGAYLIKTIGP